MTGALTIADMLEISEQEEAKAIAERWLDFKMNPFVDLVPGDPDCDGCILARQYLRVLDINQRLRAEIELVSK